MSNLTHLASLAQKHRNIDAIIGKFKPWEHDTPEGRLMKLERCRLADQIQEAEMRARKVH